MANTWAILIDVPGAKRRAYLLPADLDAGSPDQVEATEHALTQAKADAGYPADPDTAEIEGWSASVVTAPLHPNLLKVVELIDWSGGVPE